MSNYRLAKEIGMPAQRIGEIVAGKRAITADTYLRLCRFFGLSDRWCLRLQADFDTEVAKASLGCARYGTLRASLRSVLPASRRRSWAVGPMETMGTLASVDAVGRMALVLEVWAGVLRGLDLHGHAAGLTCS